MLGMYLNNNNSRSDDYTFVTETPKNTNYKYKDQSSFNNTINVDYDYNNNESFYYDQNDTKNNSKISPYSNTTPFIDAIYSRQSKPKEAFTNNPIKPNANTSNHQPFSSPNNNHLNPSDDEALENYLNDLAKNYDDIDRRIRDAERFVSQIEEAQTTKRFSGDSIKSTNNKNTKNFSATKNDDLDMSNQVKYVTELRVNIADNGSTNDHNNFKEPNNLRSWNTFNPVTPVVRKSSLLSSTNTPTYQSHLMSNPNSKYPTTNNNPNQQFYYEPRFNNRSVTDESTNESNHKMDYENDYLIPPPQLYINNPYYDDFYVNKEVQTNDYGYENFCINRNSMNNNGKQVIMKSNQPMHVEERSVQTLSPIGCMIKATVDTGVGTDGGYQNKRKHNRHSTLIRKNSSNHPYQNSFDTDYENPDNNNSETEITSAIHNKSMSQQIKGSFDQTDDNLSTKSNLSQHSNAQQTRKYSRRSNKIPNNSGDYKSFTSNDEDNVDENKYSTKKSAIKSSSSSMKSITLNTKTIPQKLKSKSINSNRKGNNNSRKTKSKRTSLSTSFNDNTLSTTVNNRQTFNHLLDSIPIDQLETKDLATQNASFEIQKLLENLGNHLQATMSIKEPKLNSNDNLLDMNNNVTEHSNGNFYPQDNSTSFWDNPLHKNDLNTDKPWPISSKKVLIANNKFKSKKMFKLNTTPNPSTPSTVTNINSELEAICKTIDKDRHFDDKPDESNKLMHKQASFNKNSRNKTPNSSMPSSGKLLGAGDQVTSNTMPNAPSATPINNSSQQIQQLTQQQIQQQLSNYKVTKTFELSPYDDLIKSHLSPFDRRVKAVAAKNGCRIVIDGPINIYDPSSCQAFRNKVTYRCIVAGQSKENLDKCMNYLKETFPNTFLRTNQRNY